MPAPKDPIKRKRWIENIRKGRIGYKETEEHKEKIKKGMTKPDVKQKMIDNHADVSGKNNPMFGKGYLLTGENNGMFGKGYKITGEKNGNWKGCEYQKANGRWFICVDGIRYKRSRYIAMKHLGRELTKEEVVHHINNNCSDDRPENLYVFSSNIEHSRHHGWKITPILTSNLL